MPRPNLGAARAASVVGAGLPGIGDMLMRMALRRSEEERLSRDFGERERHNREIERSSRLQALGATGDAFLPETPGMTMPQGAQRVDVLGAPHYRVPRPAPEPKLPSTIELSSGIYTRGEQGLEPLIDPTTGKAAQPYRAASSAQPPSRQFLNTESGIVEVPRGGGAPAALTDPATGKPLMPFRTPDPMAEFLSSLLEPGAQEPERPGMLSRLGRLFNRGRDDGAVAATPDTAAAGGSGGGRGSSPLTATATGTATEPSTTSTPKPTISRDQYDFLREVKGMTDAEIRKRYNVGR